MRSFKTGLACVVAVIVGVLAGLFWRIRGDRRRAGQAWADIEESLVKTRLQKRFDELQRLSVHVDENWGKIYALHKVISADTDALHRRFEAAGLTPEEIVDRFRRLRVADAMLQPDSRAPQSDARSDGPAQPPV